MTGIVLTGLALVFAGCNSEKVHDQAKVNAAKSHADAERMQAGVVNASPQCDKVVNQADAKAQGAIAAAQFTVDKAAADAHAMTADAARTAATAATDAGRTAADVDRLKNDAARNGQDVLDDAKRDLNMFKNSLR
jgi:hypothetical protein